MRRVLNLFFKGEGEVWVPTTGRRNEDKRKKRNSMKQESNNNKEKEKMIFHTKTQGN